VAQLGEDARLTHATDPPDLQMGKKRPLPELAATPDVEGIKSLVVVGTDSLTFIDASFFILITSSGGFDPCLLL
jgi:hypothetical protein